MGKFTVGRFVAAVVLGGTLLAVGTPAEAAEAPVLCELLSVQFTGYHTVGGVYVPYSGYVECIKDDKVVCKVVWDSSVLSNTRQSCVESPVTVTENVGSCRTTTVTYDQHVPPLWARVDCYSSHERYECGFHFPTMTTDCLTVS